MKNAEGRFEQVPPYAFRTSCMLRSSNTIYSWLVKGNSKATHSIICALFAYTGLPPQAMLGVIRVRFSVFPFL